MRNGRVLLQNWFFLLKREHEKETIDGHNPNIFESWISVIKSEYECRFQSLEKHEHLYL